MLTMTGSTTDAATAQFQRTVAAYSSALTAVFAGVPEPDTSTILSHATELEVAESRAFAEATRSSYQRAVAAAEGL